VTAAGSSYKGFRFPPEIISHCVWLYHRFPLSFRDVQELMLSNVVSTCPMRRSGSSNGWTPANDMTPLGAKMTPSGAGRSLRHCVTPVFALKN
jgi:hypothetical protein